MVFLSSRCTAKSNCYESLVQLPVKQADSSLATFTVVESWNHLQVGRISRIIWSNLCWQKHGLEKMAQHPVQPHLKSAQHWGIHCFPGEVIPVTDCSHCETFSSCVHSESPQQLLVPISLVFSMWLLIKRESPSSLCPPVNTGTWK